MFPCCLCREYVPVVALSKHVGSACETTTISRIVKHCTKNMNLVIFGSIFHLKSCISWGLFEDEQENEQKTWVGYQKENVQPKIIPFGSIKLISVLSVHSSSIWKKKLKRQAKIAVQLKYCYPQPQRGLYKKHHIVYKFIGFYNKIE
jgi:hypothetical protein